MILAIDPGPTESAFCYITDTYAPAMFDKVPNSDMQWLINAHAAEFADASTAIEMVASYGMPVGAEVFETCVWIGRFTENLLAVTGREPQLVKRKPVAVHHCHSAKANDATVKQALVDRFALGVRNHGKGTKAQPGWFYGFHADVWSAYAIAVYVADQAADSADFPNGVIHDLSERTA